MSELRKANAPEATYFLTFTVVGWVDVFVRKEYFDVLAESFVHSQKHKELEIFSYVIMPSHVHLIARRRKGRLGDWLRDFKGFTARRLLDMLLTSPQESRKDWLKMVVEFHGRKRPNNKYLAFWQPTNYPIEIFSKAVFEQKQEYIHLNPVKAGLVTQPEAYMFSSANPLSPIPIDEY